MSDYTFLSLETIIDTNLQCADLNNNTKSIQTHYSYMYTCQKPLFCGWKAVQGFTNEQLHQQTMMDYLLNIRENSEIPCNKIETKISFDLIGAPHYTEARLIQLLEEKEIGRPSTYSAIVEKIKEREYVKKQNVSGQKVECVEHLVETQEKKISCIKTWREFGNENNKLIITPLGKNVVEFLVSHFPDLFSYNYTRNMESQLDDIAITIEPNEPTQSKDKLKTVCDECFREIRENIAKYKTIKKEKTFFKIDEEHVFLNGKYGPVVMVLRPADIEKYSNIEGEVNYNELIQNDNVTFKRVKPGIMIEDLQNGKYTTTNLSEILVEESLLERVIGTYGGFDVLLKNGRFGKYVLWGKDGIQRKSIEKTHLQSKTIPDISLDEVIRIIENEPESDASTDLIGIIRTINDDISIRNGKYGDYIFYKTANMKKPKFISLKGLNKDHKKCADADIILFVNENI